MKKHAGTIVLVLLALALGVWLWRDRDRVTDDERKRRENSVFVAWRRDELTQLRVAHDGETIVLEREAGARARASEGKEGEWRMTSPRQERADPVAVERLLSALEFATVVRKVADGAAGLGLDAPRATGAVQMGKLTTSFALGAESPRPQGSDYFRVGDGPPLVVTKELADALLAPSDTYRDRAVVPYLATELARFAVVRPSGSPEGEGFALERIDERSFRLAPQGILASRSAVEHVWAALAEMRAEAFPRDADVDRLTAHPVLTVTMTPKDASKPAAELVIGEACPSSPNDVVVLRRAPTRVAACAPKDIVAALSGSAASMVDAHPFALRMDEIEELRLARSASAEDAGAAVTGPSSVEIARKGTGFHARAPFDRDLTVAEADAASELVTRIANAEATSVTRGPPAGGAPFVAVARATARLGEVEQVIEIGPSREGGRATLRRVLDDARLEADASLVRLLSPRETSLRPRTVLEHETRRVSRVVLRCGEAQELADTGAGFRLVAPPGYEADGAIAQLIDSVLRGHVEAWVADQDDARFGFTRDGCHVVLAFEDGNAPVTLWLGAEGEGGVHARVDAAPARAGVMVVPSSWRELAGRIYVSRGSLRTEASAIDQVRVTTTSKASPLREPAALREAAAGLFAERVVAIHDASRPRARPDLVIELTLASDAGRSRTVSCSAASGSADAGGGGERLCRIDGVDATFAVSEARVAAFFERADRDAH